MENQNQPDKGTFEEVAKMETELEVEQIEQIEQVEQDLPPFACSCDEESINSEIRLLFDMVTDLQARVTELEKRMDAFNIRASHKI